MEKEVPYRQTSTLRTMAIPARTLGRNPVDSIHEDDSSGLRGAEYHGSPGPSGVQSPMEFWIVVIALLVLWIVVLPVVALAKAGKAERETREIFHRLNEAQGRLAKIEREMARLKPAHDPVLEPREEIPTVAPGVPEAVVSEEAVPPPLPRVAPAAARIVPPPAPVAEKEPFSWERFLGVKLFAWLGGVALFFGVIFFVKYAFENNLIPPAVRISLGYVIGAGMLGGGLFIHRQPRYRVLAQAFCATAVLILYGVSFSAHAIYQLPAFGQAATFVLMALITGAAFLVAVRLEALVVAVLGMAGGFLTPELLETGQDQVFWLFGYIALLDAGLLALSRRGRWRFLIAAAAFETILTQIGWYHGFFQAGEYHIGLKTWVPMGGLVFFLALFLGGGWVRRETDAYGAGALIGLGAVAAAFVFAMLGYAPVADRYFLLYGFVFFLQLAGITMARMYPKSGWGALTAAAWGFVHLALWTRWFLIPDRLTGALAIFVAFGILHSLMVPRPMRRWAAIPAILGLLPFLLIANANQRLVEMPVNLLFAAALLMAAVLAALVVSGRQGVLIPAAVAGVLVVEAAWHTIYFHRSATTAPLFWYLLFHAVFLVFPFVFRRACQGQAAPWIASALSGVGQFILVRDWVETTRPNNMMGLLPAAFAIPAVIALLAVLRMPADDVKLKQSRLAWFGGVALLFITWIFPIQFDRQWLTVGWALEGVALLWLFRKVPHPGLQWTGLGLLAISFLRLTFNPAVFTEYPRSGAAILNWHLYTYGTVAAAQITGGIIFTDPAGRWKMASPRGVLFALGGVLLFLLLNIEIADYFTAPGELLVTFEFGGNFQRDMTYTIAWGLFALALLGLGIWKKSRHTRYAGIGLLAATLLKLFLHDLSEVGNIFRIGALVGVAVIAFVASFLYQRFYDRQR